MEKHGLHMLVAMRQILFCTRHSIKQNLEVSATILGWIGRRRLFPKQVAALKMTVLVSLKHIDPDCRDFLRHLPPKATERGKNTPGNKRLTLMVL